MPEKSQKRKLRSDQSTSQEEIENCNHSNDENGSLSEQDFENISSKIENRLSKRLRDTEFGQREILRLIETLTSKVDNLSNSASEQCSSALRFELETDPMDNLGNENTTRNVSSNINENVSNKCEGWFQTLHRSVKKFVHEWIFFQKRNVIFTFKKSREPFSKLFQTLYFWICQM